jgi:hypothetical protein
VNCGFISQGCAEPAHKFDLKVRRTWAVVPRHNQCGFQIENSLCVGTVVPGPDAIVVTPEEQEAADERAQERAAHRGTNITRYPNGALRRANPADPASGDSAILTECAGRQLRPRIRGHMLEARFHIDPGPATCAERPVGTHSIKYPSVDLEFV